jgi:hypothetical protein
LLEDRVVLSTITDPPAPFAKSAGTPLADAGMGIGTDAAGNVYTAGYTTVVANYLTSATVIKYSAAGVPEWTDQFAGTVGLNCAYAIAVDGPGNSYVAGDFRGQVAFGNVTLTSVGALDGFVIKIDTTGNVMWAHQFANTGNFGPPFPDRLGMCSPKGIAVDNAGNVVVTGIFTGHMDMDPAHAGQHYLDYPNVHPGGYVVELDAEGSFVWEAQGVNLFDNVNADALAVDANNNVYVVGNFGNCNYFNDNTANNSDLPNANSLTLMGPNITNLYVWKLNAGGTNAWVKQVTSQAYNAQIWGLGVAVDAQGDLYTTGSFNGASVDFDPTAAHPGNPDTVTSPGGNYNTFVDKMDSGGNWLWTSQITSAGDNWGTGLALDGTGNPYITGYQSADSQFGNILLTPASSAGNSYIAELSPQGAFLSADKAADLSPAGDKAAAIAVDSLGYVDITGAFGANMQWPGLPALASAGDTDIFTIKTGLTTPQIAFELVGTILHLTATDDQLKHLVMTQDPHLGMVIELDPLHLVAFKGLTAIDFTGGNGDTSVDFVSPIDVGSSPVPDLSLNMGNGVNTVNLTADFPVFNPAPWHVDISSGGSANVHTSIIGSVPVDETINLGPGNNSVISELHGVDEMPAPSTVTVNGGLGQNDIKVIYDFNPQPEPPGMPLSSPITVNVGGAGTNVVDYTATFLPSAPGGPGDPPTLIIPLVTHIGGTGKDTVHVGYDFLNAPGTPNGIIAIRAPITVDVAGTGVNSTKVDFDYAPPGNGPTVQIGAALSFNISGADNGGLIGLLMGNPALISNPDIIRGGSLDVGLTGGAGNNTISGVISLDRRSTGRVDASVSGGAGNDDLTLDIYGVARSRVKGLIEGRKGFFTAHHTSNVRVISRGRVMTAQRRQHTAL